MSLKKVAVVVPTYKTDFKDNELLSLKHLEHFLSKYDRFFVVPEKLDTKKLKKSLEIIKLPSEYFQSVRAFSELTTTEEFYKPFSKYEYILIYHLDALVFSDQLIKWCNKGCDYIGPPLFNSLIGKLSHKKRLSSFGMNGGISLRKVSSFINVLRKAKSLAQRGSNNPKIRNLWFLLAVLTNKSHGIWLKAPPIDYPFNEDGFWSFEAPKYYPKFKLAPFKEALSFAFERFPRKCFELNNRKLPFGCHAWTVFDMEFWKPYIKK